MESIKTHHLDIAYEETVIVKNLDLKIPSGKITSIIGPNGCGKSTVLKALGRILKPKSGTILLKGQDIHQLKTKEIAKKMAILPQTPTAPSGLAVQDLIAYGRFPHQSGFGKLNQKDIEMIDWALSVTRLTDLKLREVDTLSGGQRQRVWIAMALAQETDLILLDEPTTYLDLAHQLEILELLKDLNENQGCTIAMVLHDLNLAARFSDYMIAVREGGIVKEGIPDQVMTAAVLKKVFSIDAEIVRDPRLGHPVCITYDILKEEPVKKAVIAI